MAKNNTVVYRHRTLDTHEVFYIGIGTKKRSGQTSNRSKFWKNVAHKHGFYIEIIKDSLEWDTACELEEFLISEYGRRDLGTGILVNMTNGGEGSPGIIVSQKTRNKLRLANIGKKLSEEHKRKIGKANKGKVPSSITKVKQIESASKKVLNTRNGDIYASCREVSSIFNIEYQKLNRQLNGYSKNKTIFKYLNNE